MEIVKTTKYSFKRYENYLIAIVGIILALLLRFSLIDFISGDFKTFLNPWYNFILQNGKFWALKYDFSNYNTPYLYLLVIASYIFSSLSNITAVKLISITFDFIGAFFVYKIVKLKYPQGLLPITAFITVLFAPTVFLNSAFWGQCDMIYTSFLLACIYFVLIKKESWAFISFGLAFSFKQQAIFLVPFMLILLLKKEVSWKSCFFIPIVYLLALIPAWFAGRPFIDLLLIYVNQADTYQALSLNAPNMYRWIWQQELYSVVLPIGLLFALTVVVILCLAVYRSSVKLNKEIIIQLAMISVFIMPYCLPKMHERYFFAADVVSIIFGFYFPKYWLIPTIIIVSSFLSYTPFLFGEALVSLFVLSLILVAVLITLLNHLDRTIRKSKA